MYFKVTGVTIYMEMLNVLFYSIVVWDLKKKVAICGSPAQVPSAGDTLTALFSNQDENTIVTGGMDNLRVWQLDVEKRKIRPAEVNVGNLKRTIRCIEVLV